MALCACNTSKVSFKCGPALNEKTLLKSFKPLVAFLDLKPGDVFADIGASSGYYDATLAYLVDSVTFYIQDIDTSCLNERELHKILDYYSVLGERSLEATNTFKIVIGEINQTNLPNNTIDKIYTNGTFHLFGQPHVILQDIRQKLKPGGFLFIRDDFNQAGENRICEGENCQVPLVQYNHFLKLMADNGFKLLEISDEIGPYPVHKFVKI